MPVLHSLHTIDVEPGELGVTVRLGEKWQKLAPVGTVISLCECSDRCTGGEACGDTADTCENCTLIGAGEVIDLFYGVFKHIPARFLEHEHEIRSRYYSGLLASMTKAYGGWTDFNEESFVTVLTYVRVS